ncbi:rCG50335, partial [Rattus norvegicus]
MHLPPPGSPEQCITILKVERGRRGNRNDHFVTVIFSLFPRQWRTFINWLLWDFNWVLNSINKLKANIQCLLSA